jgi:hypothetical protein
VVLSHSGFVRVHAPPLGYRARASASVLYVGKLRVVPQRQVRIRGADASARETRVTMDVSQIVFGPLQILFWATANSGPPFWATESLFLMNATQTDSPLD